MALTALAGLVSESSELAGAEVIVPEDLRRYGLGVPAQASRQEFSAFVAEYAAAVDAPLASETRNTYYDAVVERIAADPRTVTLVPADWAVPSDAGVRLVAACPVPHFPWYFVWRTANPQPLVDELVRALRDARDLSAAALDGSWLPSLARRDIEQLTA